MNHTTYEWTSCELEKRCYQSQSKTVRQRWRLFKPSGILCTVKVDDWVPSVLWLWHCWLGVRKSIWPMSDEGVNVVICLDQDADCLHMVQLMPLPSPSSFASFKSRLVLPFGYCLTQVVLEKKLLNGCSSSDSKSRWLLIVACQTRNMMRSVGPWHNSCHQFMIDWLINARK